MKYYILFLISACTFLYLSLLSCNSNNVQKDKMEDRPNVDIEHNISFTLFETYSDKKGYPASAYGYIESCTKLEFNKSTTIHFNDSLMIGYLYFCNRTKNFKSITRLKCDSLFSYKFKFDKIKLLDYELLDFLGDYSDSIIHIDIDGKEIYRDSFKRTRIILDVPILDSNLRNC